MDSNGPLPETELTLATGRRRPRPGRVACLGLLLAFSLGAVVAGHSALAPATVDQAAVRSVDGRSSATKVAETTAPHSSASVIHGLRKAAAQITVPRVTAAPTTTTTAAPTTTSTTTTAPPTTTTTTAPPRPTTTTTAPPTTTTQAPKPAAAPARTQSGQATWYRWKAGNCAHNSLPKGTVVTVTNTANGSSATCTVGDRGAFGPPTIIDLDATVFEKIAPLGAGRINVTISW